MSLLSVIVPCYNEEESVALFYRELTKNDPFFKEKEIELELLYIDDLIQEMLDALEGKPHRCEFDGVNTVLTADGRYCAAPVTHKATLGQIVSLLDSFRPDFQLVLP